MDKSVVTEITKTYTENNVRMKVTMEDGDIVKIMFHREILEGNEISKKWLHMFSLKSTDLFSNRDVNETLNSLTKLCHKARALLESMGG